MRGDPTFLVRFVERDREHVGSLDPKESLSASLSCPDSRAPQGVFPRTRAANALHVGGQPRLLGTRSPQSRELHRDRPPPRPADSHERGSRPCTNVDAIAVVGKGEDLDSGHPAAPSCADEMRFLLAGAKLVAATCPAGSRMTADELPGCRRGRFQRRKKMVAAQNTRRFRSQAFHRERSLLPPSRSHPPFPPGLSVFANTRAADRHAAQRLIAAVGK